MRVRDMGDEGNRQHGLRVARFWLQPSSMICNLQRTPLMSKQAKVDAGVAMSGLQELALEAYVDASIELLKLERDAEVSEATAAFATRSSDDLASAGISLFRLTVGNLRVGLMGRSVADVGDAFGRPLPAHRFTVGDIVGIALSARGKGAATRRAVAASSGDAREQYDASGVVTVVTQTSIGIALDSKSGPTNGDGDGDVISLGDHVRLDRLADDVTFKRLTDALAALRTYSHGEAAKLIRILFATGNDVEVEVPEFESERHAVVPPSALDAGGPASVAPIASTRNAVALQLTRPGFNASQTLAIDAALRARHIVYVMGPPGTGKTTTLVEYIVQEAARGRTVLACAPSNVAVDNLLERLAVATVPVPYDDSSARVRRRGGLRLVRLGHPARVSSSVIRHTLDALVAEADGTALARDARQELAGVSARAAATRDKTARRELRGEEKRLRTEIRRREERVVHEIIRGADVVLCTNAGAATKQLRRSLTVPSPGEREGERGRVRRCILLDFVILARREVSG